MLKQPEARSASHDGNLETLFANPKARQILSGARSAFNDLGYEGTSVDEIARRARVSKPTVYNHFADKEALFAASFAHECREQSLSTFDVAPGESHAPGDCIETKLRRFARNFLRYALSPAHQNNFRMAVAETQRFPEVGRGYYESGPALRLRSIQELLQAGIESGSLAVKDIELASHQFVQLCKADLFMKRLLFVGDKPTEADIARVADGAVWVFLKAYRPEPQPN